MILQVITYEIDGKKIVMTPNLDCGFTIEEIAEKDVPVGVKYAIVDSGEIPIDTEPQIITPPVNQDLADVWEAIFALSATKEGGE